MRKIKTEAYELMVNGDLFEKNDNLIWWKSMDTKGFDEYKMMDGIPLSNVWPGNVIVYVTGEIDVDLFRGGPYYKIISDKVRDIISHKWSDSTEFLPVKVVHHESKKEFGSYWVLNVVQVLEALDEENTMWNVGHPPPPDERIPHASYIKPALKREVILGKGIFRIRWRDSVNGAANFITNELREDLQKAHATLGMDFLPVKVT
jgi:hypothetical protein